MTSGANWIDRSKTNWRIMGAWFCQDIKCLGPLYAGSRTIMTYHSTFQTRNVQDARDHVALSHLNSKDYRCPLCEPVRWHGTRYVMLSHLNIFHPKVPSWQISDVVHTRDEIDLAELEMNFKALMEWGQCQPRNNNAPRFGGGFPPELDNTRWKWQTFGGGHPMLVRIKYDERFLEFNESIQPTGMHDCEVEVGSDAGTSEVEPEDMLAQIPVSSQQDQVEVGSDAGTSEVEPEDMLAQIPVSSQQDQGFGFRWRAFGGVNHIQVDSLGGISMPVLTSPQTGQPLMEFDVRQDVTGRQLHHKLVVTEFAFSYPELTAEQIKKAAEYDWQNLPAYYKSDYAFEEAHLILENVDAVFSSNLRKMTNEMAHDESEVQVEADSEMI